MPYDPDITSVRSGNPHTLTLATPIVHDGGTMDYNNLTNKPRINGIVLEHEITLDELGLPEGPLTADDIDELIGE